MLKDSSIRELEEYKDKVSELGAEFSSKEDVQGATFAYVLYMMTEHVLVDAIDNLQVCTHACFCEILTNNMLCKDTLVRQQSATCASCSSCCQAFHAPEDLLLRTCNSVLSCIADEGTCGVGSVQGSFPQNVQHA